MLPPTGDERKPLQKRDGKTPQKRSRYPNRGETEILRSRRMENLHRSEKENVRRRETETSTDERRKTSAEEERNGKEENPPLKRNRKHP